IGATTENPFFAVNAPLVSRSQIFQFEPLSEAHIASLMRRALMDEARGLGRHRATITDEALAFLARTSDGDARRALMALEVAVLSFSRDPKGSASPSEISIDLAVAQDSIQRKAIVYDGTGDEHYDAASALIKSMRGSDPDAALYWLARMLAAGEDPRFIARRMVILASEDIGNADPMALVVATSVAQAVELIGMPECKLNLAQGATYLATCPKDNASYKGLLEAEKDAKEQGNLPVPLHLRNAPTDLMKDLGYGKEYRYVHDDPAARTEQTHLPEKLGKKKYYRPKKKG
ncbi:MAG: replication-associated recombination protein A, partial [Terriglobales bacterium]